MKFRLMQLHPSETMSWKDVTRRDLSEFHFFTGSGKWAAVEEDSENKQEALELG